jgi:hypothetical protein
VVSTSDALAAQSGHLLTARPATRAAYVVPGTIIVTLLTRTIGTMTAVPEPSQEQ